MDSQDLNRAAADIRQRLDDITGPDPGEDERELLDRIVAGFLDRTPPAVDDLIAAVRRGDAADARTRAHKLKGSAGNLGARGLAEVFCALELQARDGRLPDPDGALAGINAEFDLVRAVLATAVGG